MGFFDFLTGGTAGQLKRHTKRLCNLDAQREDRNASAHWLAEEGSKEAIIGLLGRFGLNYEHRMKDAEEKTFIFNLLVDVGPSVTDPVRAWVRKSQSFAHPLKLIQHFEGEEAVVEVLLDLLGREVDPFKVEKKRQILVQLAKHKDARIVERVPACLEDFDEGVRYAAATALISQESETVKPDLLAVLARATEDSNRLKDQIAIAFHSRNWSLGDSAETIAGIPPVGWMVKDTHIFPTA